MKLRRGTGSLYRKLQSLKFLLGRDRRAVASFLAARWPVDVPLKMRIDLIARFVAITNDVRAYHTQAELLTVAERILALAGRPGLTVVECGAGKGGSSAKLSLVTLLAGGRLFVFDSFRGIPENDEEHVNLDGRPVRFRAGAFAGTIGQVRRAIERYGAPEVCRLEKGLFAETLPAFRDPIDVALLDVDLLSSTRECLVNLFPRVRPGGSVFTQDGHLRAIVDLLGSERFWRDEVGVEPPTIPGLGREKLLEIRPRG